MKDLSEKNLFKIGDVPIKIILVLLSFTIIGYWPVSTGLFALKNDAINYFLPYRYSIVESIRNGHLPFWSPYISMGFPLNGDMQSGAFNPVVWFLSIFGSYTLWSLHIETLFYLFLGSIGFYKLLKEFKCANSTSLTISIAYLFCGFLTGNGQNIAWIANAALLPFSYIYFYRILVQKNWRNSLKLALAMFMLFVAGYPFFFICTCYLLLLISVIWIGYQWRDRSFQSIRVFSKQILFAIVASVLLCIAPLYHYLYMMPHYERGEAISLELALTNSLPPKSLVSLLFPWSVTKSEVLLETDMSHLNSYIGILTVPFILVGMFSLKKKLLIPILVLLIAIILLSFGKWGLIRSWTFDYLPLMNRFRHPANFRIFSIQIFLILAALGLGTVSQKLEDQPFWKLVRVGIFGLGLATTLMLIIFWPANFEFLGKFGNNTRQGLKNFGTSIGLNGSIFITGIIQILFLSAGYYAITKNSIQTYLGILVSNVVVLGQLAIFTTFVSKSPIGEIEKYILYEKGFPIPTTKQSIQCDSLKTFGYPPGLKHIFSKKLVIQEDFTNPSYLKTYASFANDGPMKDLVSIYPAAYLADTIVDENSVSTRETRDAFQTAFLRNPLSGFNPTSPLQRKLITITHFGPNRFEFDAEPDKPAYLCLFQANYPYWRAQVDGKPMQITTVNRCFMSVPLTIGKHHVLFEIKNDTSTVTYIISLLALLTCGPLLFLQPKKINLSEDKLRII